MKKTKLIVAGLMMSTMLIGGVSQAFAADSTGEITFTENQGGGDPSDPEDPSNPKPDPKPDPTPEVGPLIIKVVPKFDFGTHEVEQAGKTYDDTETKNTYIEVRDNRSAGINGWEVTASRTEFSDGSKELTGSALSLPKGIVRNSIASTEQGNSTTADEVPEASIKASAQDIPLTGSSAKVLETVKKHDLVGKANTTSNIIETDRTSLTVAPGTAAAGTFTSTITWTITAAP
ncbi:WxL domain-containing protein [Enterococcus hulanensis]|uniref:WxL domain-containing protein n=1 Tax=Enterococcus hulanensis TaxID=2559929 RepID=A0ABU3EUG5_9ENTE|nr:WxL domain-containing protein [Enterococcus hulanensis]MDT2598498.1 WxL domain-containing protein [Enterococcus hulanensis]MDT2607997.1 WxL domain-containing protein [Enterococcus hulanensis]MDT2615292.1 WxL domain-containing protein [Enterococcus hulanensis]MDT2626737.1 WxL domain-containing protein [Enterococcus hulanensis]MDT2654364.1 WxL domain-containing protein [Enterococcus hulanensis]